MTTPFDWSNIITRVVNETPPDVIFVIPDGDIKAEVDAHKMVLGMISLVFRRSFFSTDTTDRTAQRIEILETTKPAFQIMVDAIYNRTTINASLKDKSVDEVFAVVNIVKRFEISELVVAVTQFLSTFSITDDTVLEVASEAMEYSALFKEESRQLLLTCAKFLKPKLKDATAIFGYIAENEEQKEVISSLFVLMNDIPPTAPTCSNCKKEPCQDGVGVGDNDFWEGLNVGLAPQNYWGVGNNFLVKGEVTRLNGSQVQVRGVWGFPRFFFKSYTPNGRFPRFFFKSYTPNGSTSQIQNFIFSCK